MRLFWNSLAFALILLGGAASGYLLLWHFAVHGGNSQLFDICRLVLQGDCDEAIRSPMAVQLGIPLAGWGVVHFATLGTALALALAVGDSFRAAGMLLVLLLGTVAAVLGIILTGMMVTGSAPFCPLCVLVHTVSLLLVPVLILTSGFGRQDVASGIGEGVRYVFGAPAEQPVLARWNVVGFLTVGLVAVVAYQWVLIQTDRQALAGQAPLSLAQVLEKFEAGETHDIPVGEEDPWKGDRDSETRIVLFSDFECPACRNFASVVSHLREHHPQLAVVFKHYPLSSACNVAVSSELHPGSCNAAYAAEAARRQSKFWEYHDALFKTTDQLEPAVLNRLAAEIGLDMEQFEADLADPATREKVQADVELGSQLQIPGTPTPFLNGRELSDLALSRFEEIVEHYLHDEH